MSKANSIERRFGKSALSYDGFAPTQAYVAKSLVGAITSSPKTIFEIGCGTGLLTAELVAKFPDAKITVSDISTDMLAACRAKFVDNPQLEFLALNAETEPLPGCYDLIALSMVAHWFSDTPKTLAKLQQHLNPRGVCYFSTIGEDCFIEWQQALMTLNLPLGLRIPPALEGIFFEEKQSVLYSSAGQFLQTLSQTGAHQPADNYKPMSPAQLKSAMGALDRGDETKLTWHILYGRLSGEASY